MFFNNKWIIHYISHKVYEWYILKHFKIYPECSMICISKKKLNLIINNKDSTFSLENNSIERQYNLSLTISRRHNNQIVKMTWFKFFKASYIQQNQLAHMCGTYNLYPLAHLKTCIRIESLNDNAQFWQL